MSTLSTHVLDTSLGRPASGIHVTLARLTDEAGQTARVTTIGAGDTDVNGRLADFTGGDITEGVYRLRFDVASHFSITGRTTFFAEVLVTFVVGAADEHYHIPLLLSPYGYTTYRGA
jgi:5-hydroxyisourate hydrolase